MRGMFISKKFIFYTVTEMKDLKELSPHLFKKRCKGSCLLCEYGLSDILRAWMLSGEIYKEANHWIDFFPHRCEGKYKETKVPKFLLLDFRKTLLGKKENFDIFMKGIEVLKTGPCSVCASSNKKVYENAMRNTKGIGKRWILLESMSKKLGENLSRSDFWIHHRHVKKKIRNYNLKEDTYKNFYRCTRCAIYIRKEEARIVEYENGSKVYRCPRCNKQLRLKRRTKRK